MQQPADDENKILSALKLHQILVSLSSPSLPGTHSTDGSNGTSAYSSLQQQQQQQQQQAQRVDPPLYPILADIADNFVMDVMAHAALLAQHRQSTNVSLQDVQFYLEREWDMNVGYAGPSAEGSEADRSNEERLTGKKLPSGVEGSAIGRGRRTKGTEEHKARMARTTQHR